MKIDKSKKKVVEKVLITTNIDFEVGYLIRAIIDKVGAKKTLNFILSRCLTDTLENVSFPTSLLSGNAENEEIANVTCALYYLKKNWDFATDEGMKLLNDAVKKAREKNENRI